MNTLGDLHGKRVLVWGARLEGRSVVNRMWGLAEFRVVVDLPTEGDPADYVALTSELGVPVTPPTADLIDWCEAIVRSPIIHPDRAELAEARAAGKIVGHPVGLWMAAQRTQPVIGVTGTKGKSTTSSLLAGILTEAGQRVGLGGNIEIPITELPHDCDVYVVEVSSYMATDSQASPRFGVLTNLSEDHVTWHGSVERYHADKMRLFAFPELERIAVNGFDQPSLAATEHLPRTLYGTDGYVVDGLAVRRNDELIVDLTGSPLGNRHFALDVCAAATAASFVVGHEWVDLVTRLAIAKFVPLPCRLEPVDRFDGREFIDDALASNPLGAAAGVEAFPDRAIVVILGGEDRNVSFDPLVAALAGRSAPTTAVLISDTTELLEAALTAAGVDTVAVGGQEVGPAVRIAYEVAAGVETIVLFSPGAPTPRWFGYHTDRSRAFKEEVHQLAAESRRRADG